MSYYGRSNSKGIISLPKKKSYISPIKSKNQETELNYNSCRTNYRTNKNLDSKVSNIFTPGCESNTPIRNEFTTLERKYICTNPHKANCIYCGLISNGLEYIFLNSSKRYLSPQSNKKKNFNKVESNVSKLRSKSNLDTFHSTHYKTSFKNYSINQSKLISQINNNYQYPLGEEISKDESVKQYLASEFKYASLIPGGEEYNKKINEYIDSLSKYRHFKEKYLTKNIKEKEKKRVHTKSDRKHRLNFSNTEAFNKIVFIQRYWKRFYMENIIPNIISIQKLFRGFKIRKRIQSVNLIINHVTQRLKFIEKFLKKGSLIIAFQKLKRYEKKKVSNSNLLKGFIPLKVYFRKIAFKRFKEYQESYKKLNGFLKFSQKMINKLSKKRVIETLKKINLIFKINENSNQCQLYAKHLKFSECYRFINCSKHSYFVLRNCGKIINRLDKWYIKVYLNMWKVISKQSVENQKKFTYFLKGGYNFHQIIKRINSKLNGSLLFMLMKKAYINHLIKASVFKYNLTGPTEKFIPNTRKSEMNKCHLGQDIHFTTSSMINVTPLIFDSLLNFENKNKKRALRAIKNAAKIKRNLHYIFLRFKLKFKRRIYNQLKLFREKSIFTGIISKKAMINFVGRSREISLFLRKIDFLFTLSFHFKYNVKQFSFSLLFKNYIYRSIANPKIELLLNILNIGFDYNHLQMLSNNLNQYEENKIKSLCSRNEYYNHIDFLAYGINRNIKAPISLCLKDKSSLRNIYSFNWWDSNKTIQKRLLLEEEIEDSKDKNLNDNNKNIIEYLKNFIQYLENEVIQNCQYCKSNCCLSICEGCISNLKNKKNCYNFEKFEIGKIQDVSLLYNKKIITFNTEHTNHLQIQSNYTRKFKDLKETSINFDFIEDPSYNKQLELKVTMRKAKNANDVAKKKYNINDIFGKIKAKKGIVNDIVEEINDTSSNNNNISVFDKSELKSVFGKDDNISIKSSINKHKNIMAAMKTLGNKNKDTDKVVLRDDIISREQI